MDWSNVVGSVASVINTALPLLFGSRSASDEDALLSSSGSINIGPATFYKVNNNYNFANFGEPDQPILFTFSSAEGLSSDNLTVQLNYGEKFTANDLIAAYTDGSVTICLANRPPERSREALGVPTGVLEGLWNFATTGVIAVGQTVTAIVNPNLTLRFLLRVEANNQVVVMTAIGTVAYLGGKYLTFCTNNANKNGARSGDLVEIRNNLQISGNEEEKTYLIDLPTGVDYSDGIYAFQLQLPISLQTDSVASDTSISFEAVDRELIEKHRRLREHQ